MPFLPKQWFWFISHAKLARIIEAKDRQEANRLYTESYPDQEDPEQKVLITMPAEKCPHCGKFVQPIGGYIEGVWYGVPICREEDHTQYVPVLGELSIEAKYEEDLRKRGYSDAIRPQLGRGA